MAILSRRSRLVSFRLSDEEYKAIENACLVGGNRSVADFVRAALLARVIALNTPQGLLSSDLATLGHQLTELGRALDEIQARITRVLGTSGKSTAMYAGYSGEVQAGPEVEGGAVAGRR